MIEMTDFAAALRQMADNADRLAQRHDVKDMAALRQQVTDQEVKAQRDGDLIAELRKLSDAMGRQLDSIGRLRKNVVTGHAPADVVMVLTDALLIVADGGCENYVRPYHCRDESHGRTRTAPGTADAWCKSCVAQDALERVGAVEPAGTAGGTP